jgi:hypothetical protein
MVGQQDLVCCVSVSTNRAADGRAFFAKALELFCIHHDTLDTLALAEAMQVNTQHTTHNTQRTTHNYRLLVGSSFRWLMGYPACACACLCVRVRVCVCVCVCV